MNANLDKMDPEGLGNPQALILLYEENNPNDGACAPGASSDVLASRHFGRSSAMFVDGHVEMVSPRGGRKVEHALPVDRPPTDLKYAGLPAKDALKDMSLPSGFRVSLFASEPDVRQPVAFCIDDRGRLWVAECYTYPKRKGDPPSGTPGTRPSKEQLSDIFGGKDRVLVFEDKDGDGRFDKRTVFLEKLNLLSGLEVGFGGVWIGAAPYLMFVPVKDWENPKPAGEPEILLDGWDYKSDTHEMLNTFTWGPDGWLYGCHGVTCASSVGAPGTSKEQRQWLDAAVWRYHPKRRVFEVFAEGTSNPWGIDFDEHGQCFVEACVIPHLFHMIQGGRYQRQGDGPHYAFGAEEIQRIQSSRSQQSFGKLVNPYVYEEIKTVADHLHYRGIQWNDHDRRTSWELGGGHAHAGLLIYQGDSLPAEYRGQIFMNNIHGQRIVMDIPERLGSGFVGKHGADFIRFNDKWSQVLNLLTGPDGSVFMIDWYDKIQCHEELIPPDRSNGRIFKVSHGERNVADIDLQKLSNEELVMLLASRNCWHFRHAARILQERFGNSDQLAHVAVKLLTPILEHSTNQIARLHALWVLNAANSFSSADFALRYLKDDDEYIRAWTVQFACEERNVSAQFLPEFARLAREDRSPIVRLYLASALQRLPVILRVEIVEGLLAHGEDAADHNLPLMYWYAAEPLAGKDVATAAKLLAKTKIPKVRELITRRMTSSSVKMAGN